jgi:uncharacterized membrane protein
MKRAGHLWAVGFGDTGRADQVRGEIARLGSEKHDLILLEDAVLNAIRGLGGTVLKTNVDMERAKLIQSALAALDDTAHPNTS